MNLAYLAKMFLLFLRVQLTPLTSEENVNLSLLVDTYITDIYNHIPERSDFQWIKFKIYYADYLNLIIKRVDYYSTTTYKTNYEKIRNEVTKVFSNVNLEPQIWGLIQNHYNPTVYYYAFQSALIRCITYVECREIHFLTDNCSDEVLKSIREKKMVYLAGALGLYKLYLEYYEIIFRGIYDYYIMHGVNLQPQILSETVVAYLYFRYYSEHPEIDKPYLAAASA